MIRKSCKLNLTLGVSFIMSQFCLCHLTEHNPAASRSLDKARPNIWELAPPEEQLTAAKPLSLNTRAEDCDIFVTWPWDTTSGSPTLNWSRVVSSLRVLTIVYRIWYANIVFWPIEELIHLPVILVHAPHCILAVPPLQGFVFFVSSVNGLPKIYRFRYFFHIELEPVSYDVNVVGVPPNTEYDTRN